MDQTDHATVRLLEELTFGCWPPATVHRHDGWIAGISDSTSRRVRSVLPLQRGELSLADRVSYFEEYYHRQSLPCCFKLTSSAQPAELDSFLEERGYFVEAPTAVATLRPANGFTIDSRVDTEADRDDWLLHFSRCSSMDRGARRLLREQLDRIDLPVSTVVLREGRAWVAFALLVTAGEWSYVGNVLVAPGRRRTGLGRALLESLLAVAERKSRHVVIQVMLDNPPALALYGALGFFRRYTYWYRTETAHVSADPR